MGQSWQNILAIEEHRYTGGGKYYDVFLLEQQNVAGATLIANFIKEDTDQYFCEFLPQRGKLVAFAGFVLYALAQALDNVNSEQGEGNETLNNLTE